MKQTKIEELFAFSKLLNEFRRVERVARVNGEDRWENDVEHSYQLAMLAWFVADSRKLDFDKDKLIKYALVHDLVEVYAGDTYIYSDDPEHLASKERREADARSELVEKFSGFPDLHDFIEKYERKEEPEARFIYVLDKLQPVINIYLDGGRSWQEKGVTLEMIKNYKHKKMALAPELGEYYDELILLLEDQPELFGAPANKNS